MNLRGGRGLVRGLLMSYTSSRGFFWVLAFGHLMSSLVYMFVWMTAAGKGWVSGYSKDGFVVYYLVMMLIHEITYPTANYTVGDMIRMGLFSTWLLRPVPPIYEAVATDLAVKVVGVPFTSIVVFLLAFILRPAISFTGQGVLLFLMALLLAFALRFLLAYDLALLAFWSNRADALLRLNDTLVFLFAGMVAPTALLPGVLQQVAGVLPYRYMLGFPIEVLMGRLTPQQIIAGFAVQVAWLLAGFLIHRLVWRSGLHYYSAVGG